MNSTAWLRVLVIISMVIPIAPAAVAGSQTYTVREGETLWSIAGAILHDPYRWMDLAAANPEIADPNHIEAGQVLILPPAKGETDSVPTTTATLSPTATPTQTVPAETPSPSPAITGSIPKEDTKGETEATRLYSPSAALSRSLLEKGLHHLREASKAIEASQDVQPLENLDYRKLLDHTAFLDRQLSEFLIPLLKEREDAYRITIDNAYFRDSLGETLKRIEDDPSSGKGGENGIP